jgi:hypothetical protein
MSLYLEISQNTILLLLTSKLTMNFMCYIMLELRRTADLLHSGYAVQCRVLKSRYVPSNTLLCTKVKGYGIIHFRNQRYVGVFAITFPQMYSTL